MIDPRCAFRSLALLTAALLAPLSADAQTYTPDEMLVVLGFTVTVENPGSGSNPDGAWESMTGGGLVIEIAESSTGTDQTHQTTAGHKYVEEIALRGPLTTGRLDVADWVNATIKGEPWQRVVSVKEVLKDGSDGKTFTYLDAFPVRYVFPEFSASGTGNLYEELVVKPIRLELGGASRGVNEGSYEVLENGAGKFKVDIDNAPTASANIESVHIEDLVIDIREMTTGADWDYRVYGPGDAHFGDVTLKVRVGKNSIELYQWWLDTSQGKNIRKNISVIALKRDGSEARRYNIFGCFPISYDHGEYSPGGTVTVETVVCRPERIELG